jgi:hypothetical protein
MHGMRIAVSLLIGTAGVWLGAGAAHAQSPARQEPARCNPEERAAPPPSQAPSCLPTKAAPAPVRVILHMTKPEVVYDDAAPCAGAQDDCTCREKRRPWFHRCAPRAPQPVAPLMGSIYLPVPAMVPGVPVQPVAPPPAAPCPSQPPPAASANGGTAGPSAPELPLLRATHEVEVGVARLLAAQASHDAQVKAQQDALDRLRAGMAPVLSPPAGLPRPMASPVGDDLGTLHTRLKRLLVEMERLKKEGLELNDQLRKRLEQGGLQPPGSGSP